MADIEDTTADKRRRQREASRKWRVANPEKVRERKRLWRAANLTLAKEGETRRRNKWAAANPEKIREINRKQRKNWADANRDKVREASRKRREGKPEPRIPRYAYANQRSSAKQRNVPFLLSFEEWWAVWEASGKWEQRGRRREQYCMARFGDEGAYETGNVFICTPADNVAESNARRALADDARQRWSEAAKKGWIHHRAALSRERDL